MKTINPNSDLLAAIAGVVHHTADSLKVIITPASATLIGARGVVRQTIAWDPEQHHHAFEVLRTTAPANLNMPSPFCASLHGDAIVLRRARPALDTADALDAQLISELALETLSGGLSSGRNLLLCGAGSAALAIAGQLGALLVSRGHHPASFADAKKPQQNTVTGALRCSEPGELSSISADRIDLWEVAPDTVANVLARSSGCVAYCDAFSVARALSRFESSFGRLSGDPATELLARLDLVGIVGPCADKRIRLRELYEIRLDADGYRPALLFKTGIAPFPEALVPVAAPEFAADLPALGFVELANEWQLFSPAPLAPTPQPSAPPTPTPGPPAGCRGSNACTDRQCSCRQTPPTPTLPSPPDAFPIAAPGWELDLLPALAPASTAPPAIASTTPSEVTRQRTEDATMAATYGLEPPPRPSGVSLNDDDDLKRALAHARDQAKR